MLLSCPILTNYSCNITPSSAFICYWFVNNTFYRYRDISFERKEIIQSTFDNCEKVLLDAKVTGYAFGKQKVRLGGFIYVSVVL